MIQADLLAGVMLPIVVWLLMLVVGMDLTLADFRRIKQYPVAITWATSLQLVSLPLIAALLIWALEPGINVAVGIFLVAICPGGSLSNYYSYLAGANSALSITLTGVSSVLAIITVPVLAAAGFSLLLEQYDSIDIPLVPLASNLTILLLLPIAVGMFLRHRYEDFVVTYNRLFRRGSLWALAGLVLIVFYDQREHLGAEVTELVSIAVIFSVSALTAGWWAGRVILLDRSDRFAVLLEFGVRNLAITAAIGASILGRVEFLLFAAVFLIVQLPILFALVVVHKQKQL